jgi:isoleucyl-tRNA synthetase
LRKQTGNRVRQPLQKILIPASGNHIRQQLDKVSNLILSEVNVKSLEYLDDSEGFLVKKIKPNYKSLGPRFGKKMKEVAATIANFSQKDILTIENQGRHMLEINGEQAEIELQDVEIVTEDIPGWVVSNQGTLTVALDITLSEELLNEGIARELINRIQGLRKDQGFEVTDKIELIVDKNPVVEKVIEHFFHYICSETLTEKLSIVETPLQVTKVQLTDELELSIMVRKL